MTPAAYERFDALCRAVAARGRGLSLSQLGDAAALARELEAEEPDPDRVDLLRRRLELDPEELAP